MKISKRGLDLIKFYESFRAKPYLDSGKVPTIGYGTIVYPDGKKVTLQDAEITEPKACEYLEHFVNKFSEDVIKLVKVQINQNQFDALISFTYNLGVGALSKSTLLLKLNKGDYAGAALEFPKWNKDNGKVLGGLVKRRKSEQDLFNEPVQNSPQKDPLLASTDNNFLPIV